MFLFFGVKSESHVPPTQRRRGAVIKNSNVKGKCGEVAERLKKALGNSSGRSEAEG